MWSKFLSLLKARTLRLVLTVVLAATLYWAADWPQVVATLGSLFPGYLLAAMLLFVPQTVVSALRWRSVVSRWAPITVVDSVRQTLVASAANLALPSKLGDFSKSAMLPRDISRPAWVGPRLVLTEKAADVAALLMVLTLGLAGVAWPFLLALIATIIATARLLPSSLTGEGPGVKRPQRTNWRTWTTITASSLALWSLHIWQIDLFLRAAGIFVASDVAAARIPLALFAGVVPLSLWGVGTRDAALIALFSDVAEPAPLAAVGLLTALRYLVPGACGVLLLARRSTSSTLDEVVAAADASPVLGRAATVASSR